jgi:macrolide-specific efflux system membrane fusion protein
LEIIGNFAEADAANIKAGQAATVTFPAISGQTGTGSVAAISPTATTSNSVTTYPVTITLSDYPTTLKLGQTATASITTKSASNVLYLPSNAVIIGSDTSSGTGATHRLRRQGNNPDGRSRCAGRFDGGNHLRPEIR